MKGPVILGIGIAIAVIVGIGGIIAYASFSRPEPIPSESELPDQVIIDNQKDLAEVQALLDKYPEETTITVDRSGRLAVDYRIEDVDTGKYLRLRVFSDNNGNPQEMFIDCYDGSNSNVQHEDIASYIETETCVE